jgi:hypothetical protein
LKRSSRIMLDAADDAPHEVKGRTRRLRRSSCTDVVIPPVDLDAKFQSYADRRSSRFRALAQQMI